MYPQTNRTHEKQQSTFENNIKSKQAETRKPYKVGWIFWFLPNTWYREKPRMDVL